MKYKLNGETIEFEGRTLYRLQCIKTFGAGANKVNEGALGGFVAGEHNLLQTGPCWIADDAKVMDRAVVAGTGRVSGNAVVQDKCKIIQGEVTENARLFDSVTIRTSGMVSGSARLHDEATVRNDANVSGSALVFDNIVLYGGTLTGASLAFGHGQNPGARADIAGQSDVVFEGTVLIYEEES